MRARDPMLALLLPLNLQPAKPSQRSACATRYRSRRKEENRVADLECVMSLVQVATGAALAAAIS